MTHLKINRVVVVRVHIDPFVMELGGDLNEDTKSSTVWQVRWLYVHGNICRTDEEARMQYTQSTSGNWERKGKVPTKEIRKVFVGERARAINLAWWLARDCVESEAGEIAFKSEALRAKEENSPLASSHCPAGPCGKLRGMRSAAFETLMMSATKEVWHKLWLNCVQMPFRSETLRWAPPVCQALCQVLWEYRDQYSPPLLSRISWCSWKHGARDWLERWPERCSWREKHGKQHFLLHAGPSSRFLPAWVLLMREMWE